MNIMIAIESIAVFSNKILLTTESDACLIVLS